MKLALYDRGRGHLLGTLAPRGRTGLSLEAYGGSWRRSAEHNLEAIDQALDGFTDEHESAEAYLQSLLVRPHRLVEALAVPDDVDLADIWPGHANDLKAEWSRYHPQGVLVPQWGRWRDGQGAGTDQARGGDPAAYAADPAPPGTSPDLRSLVEFLRREGAYRPGSRELAAQLLALLRRHPDLRRDVSAGDMADLQAVARTGRPETYARAPGTLPAPPGSLTSAGGGAGHPAPAPHPLSGSAPVALPPHSASAPVPLHSSAGGTAVPVARAPAPYAPPAAAPVPSPEAFDPRADWRTPLPEEANLGGWGWKQSGKYSLNPTFRVTDPKTGAALIAKVPAYPEIPGLALAGVHQPAQVATELAANRIHQLIGTPHVPGAGATTRGGLRYLLSRIVHKEGAPGKLAHTLYDEHDRNKSLAAVRTANSPEDLGRLALANWLIGGQDRHGGNYLIGPGGKLAPIDYGMSFHPHPDTDLISPKPDILRHTDAYWPGEPPLVREAQPLDRDMLRRIAERRPEIEREVEKLAAHYGERAPSLRAAMHERLSKAAELAGHPDPRVGHLEERWPGPGGAVI